LVVRDERGLLFNPYSISYSIFQVEGEQKILVMGPQMVPDCASMGLFWVNLVIPTGWIGEFELVWYLTQAEGDNEQRVVENFSVINMDLNKTSHEAPSIGMAPAPKLNTKTANLIATVRELLSDENPDRNYHFRPPTAGKTIAGYSQRVGFIWEDKTIIRMMNLALAFLNTANPQMIYRYTIDNVPESWAQAACVGAAAYCLSKEAARWAADEFSYSLNGVSLDINKAQLYQGLAESYKAEFKEWATPLTASKPMSVGLRQSHWLI
jgi:hypothetical protein